VLALGELHGLVTSWLHLDLLGEARYFILAGALTGAAAPVTVRAVTQERNLVRAMTPIPATAARAGTDISMEVVSPRAGSEAM
jgi:hypothetical protein